MTWTFKIDLNLSLDLDQHIDFEILLGEMENKTSPNLSDLENSGKIEYDSTIGNSSIIEYR